MNLDALAARLAAAGVRVERDVAVADLTTYHVGGPVAVLARAGAPAELRAVAEAFDGEPLLVVGRGSNLLVADAGFAGLGLVLDGAFDAVDLGLDDRTPDEDGSGEGVVWAGAAVALPVLARRAATAGRTGLEFYVGIPGTVGGAVRMNAGGHGRETADVLVDAAVADLAAGGVPTVRPVPDLGFGYRRSALSATEVVTGARFRVVDGDADGCRGRGGRDRPLAPGAPTGWVQRRLGVRQPARRLGRASRRLAGPQGSAGGRRGGVGQARQLLPGGGRRHRRRRASPRRSRCVGECSTPPGSRWCPSCA